MKPLRFVGTGLLIAVFGFVAFSGAGMFFGLKSGVMKNFHEYFGMAMLALALVHIFINFKPFKLYFKGWQGLVICAIIVLSCGYAGYSLKGASGAGNPARAVYMQALNLEISKFKGAFGTDNAKFSAFLESKGIANFDESLNLREACAKYNLKEGEILNALLPARAPKGEAGGAQKGKNSH
ncbi:DUF4405 domain-containing protein [Campylobacter sp. VBCF_03 NA9]|uniref:DUF4405 domain-containing protein n=1 Tax=Campylobacter sp. VBCF_03 NA9 TaxID=2983839 RepID=UPI0022E998ED|nr:DUF4405 domain-containing protein [Campylobacter sp. VBCF_03 NA9]MDA3071812.1 DUF4405 domain-containing protein [Campylobacter sp. VBCF_03 NA9]